jgi:hypothetical protein
MKMVLLHVYLRTMNTRSNIFKSVLLAGTVLFLMLTPSCMKDKPEALPENLEWNPQLALPLGEEEFGFDTLLLEVDTVSGNPLWMDLSEVVMTGVVDFDPSIISDNLDKLNRILFRVNSSNQFPHTMYSQAYFLDGGGTYIDSLFQEGPVESPAAKVSDMGKLIDPGLAQHDALIEGERIHALTNAQSILFQSIFIVGNVDTSLITAYPTFLFQIETGLMLDLSFED